jgi:hypothetical protein
VLVRLSLKGSGYTSPNSPSKSASTSAEKWGGYYPTRQPLYGISASPEVHCLASKSLQDQAGLPETGVDEGKGSLHRLKVFIRHETVVRVLNFLGYPQDE